MPLGKASCAVAASPSRIPKSVFSPTRFGASLFSQAVLQTGSRKRKAFTINLAETESFRRWIGKKLPGRVARFVVGIAWRGSTLNDSLSQSRTNVNEQLDETLKILLSALAITGTISLC
jgi:hypothetical protein